MDSDKLKHAATTLQRNVLMFLYRHCIHFGRQHAQSTVFRHQETTVASQGSANEHCALKLCTSINIWRQLNAKTQAGMPVLSRLPFVRIPAVAAPGRLHTILETG